MLQLQLATSLKWIFKLQKKGLFHLSWGGGGEMLTKIILEDKINTFPAMFFVVCSRRLIMFFFQIDRKVFLFCRPH